MLERPRKRIPSTQLRVLLAIDINAAGSNCNRVGAPGLRCYTPPPMELFPRTPRTKERRLLYGSIALVVGTLIGLGWFFGRPSQLDKDQDWTELDYASMPEVDLLRRYVRIDTTPDRGSEVEGAQFLAEELRKLGLEPTVEVLGDRKANVWAILEGESKEALVLHSHIDVYPIVKPDEWDHPPFSAVIDKAWLYGRGVFDMKSVTVVQLLALKELVESGQRPKKSIIFLATGSEEVGSELGARWILDEHPELTERFGVILTEGGIVEPISRHEFKYWGIEFAQKRFAGVAFCADTLEELEEVRAALTELNVSRFAPVVTEEVELFLKFYAETRDNPAYRELLENPKSLRDNPSGFLRLPFYLLALLRNEVVVFPPEEDPSGGYRMKAELHLLPGQKLETASGELLPKWITHGVEVEVTEPRGAETGSRVDLPAFDALAGAVRKTYGEAPVGPFFLGLSATDARFFRTLGAPTYGFSPFLIFSTDTFRVDGPNERMSLPGYVSGLEIYAEAVRRIAG